MNHPQYSVVIPVKNEEENIYDLINELEPVMQKIGHSWELIFVNDGSTDRTLDILCELHVQKPYIRILSFTQNFGQSSGFAAGFEAARGKYVITLDGDRQNDPADIPKLLQEAEEADLVCGWRKNRQDPVNKKVISRFSNAIRKRLCQDDMHDTGCSLKVYRRECLEKIKMYKGMHRFLPALFKIEGFRVKELPVNHRQRTRGKTKYHFFNRSIGPIVDMFVVRWMRKRHLQHQIKQEWTHD